MTKNIILTLTLFSVSFCSLSQDNNKFVLTSEGFRNDSDQTKDYIVLQFPEKSQADLYKAVLIFANSSFVSAKDVVSKVDNESISINGFAKKAVRRTNSHVFDLNYTLTIQFKDGKIRIASPSINKISTISTKYQEMYLKGATDALSGDYFSIYNKKGELKLEKAKEDLETYFNSLISKIEQAIKTENNKKDW